MPIIVFSSGQGTGEPGIQGGIALPAGWVDTGLQITYTLTGTMQMRIKQTRQMRLGEAQLSAIFTPFPPPPPFTIDNSKGVTMYAALGGQGALPFVGSHAVEQADVVGPGVAGPLSSGYTYTETGGPFRLGAQLGSDSTPGSIERENYVYGLFYDENTVWSYTFAGLAGSRQAFGLFGPIGLLYYNLGANSQADMTNAVEFIWSTLMQDGALVDASGLARPSANGTSGGRIEITNNADFLANNGGAPIYTFGGPQQFALDVDVLDYDGSPLGAGFVVDGFGTPLTTPFTGTVALQTASWLYPGNLIPTEELAGKKLSLSLTNAWLTSKGLPTNEQQAIPLQGVPPRLSPHLPGTYRPAKIKFTGRLPVLRSTNPWASSDTGKITVSGNSFHVTATGAHVTRALKENWRNWCGRGGLGHADPEFGVTRYQITKHDYLTGTANAGQDVWSWAGYGYLELQFSAAAASSLTITVSGAIIGVFDTHEETQANRAAALQVTESTFTVHYPVSIPSGSSAVQIDLLFPTEGGPFYYGRVDSVQIAGFAVGDYTLDGIDLVTREDGYLKVDWDRDYMGVHASFDGASSFLTLPDTYQKADETGPGGGALRLREPVNTGGVAPENDQKPLAAFLDEWNRIEGWAVDYDVAGSDLGTKDTFGEKLDEVSTFLPQLTPHRRLSADAVYRPDCPIRCGRMLFPNITPGPSGEPFLVYARYRLGGALEAQTTTEDQKNRGAPGATVYAARMSDGVRVASGVSDASGYVSVSPITAGGNVEYRLESDT